MCETCERGVWVLAYAGYNKVLNTPFESHCSTSSAPPLVHLTSNSLAALALRSFLKIFPEELRGMVSTSTTPPLSCL